jgi:dTMP kinase
LGDLSESVYGPALLFALDRRAAAAQLRELQAANDVVLLDRYVTSNAAYGSARLGGPQVPTGFAEWVRAIELDRFGVPAPDHQILLATPLQMAAERARDRAASSADRALDTFESDTGLQQRTAAMYAQLAGENYLSAWTVLTPGADGVVSIPAGLAD